MSNITLCVVRGTWNSSQVNGYIYFIEDFIKQLEGSHSRGINVTESREVEYNIVDLQFLNIKSTYSNKIPEM